MLRKTKKALENLPLTEIESYLVEKKKLAKAERSKLVKERRQLLTALKKVEKKIQALGITRKARKVRRKKADKVVGSKPVKEPRIAPKKPGRTQAVKKPVEKAPQAAK